jgi:hypothetical protein
LWAISGLAADVAGAAVLIAPVSIRIPRKQVILQGILHFKAAELGLL